MSLGSRPAGVQPVGTPRGAAAPFGALQFGVGLRNHLLDELEVFIGTAPELRIYSGSRPSTVAEAPTGTLLATLLLPSDWMAAASGAVKDISGSWAVAAIATATAGYFRIYDSTGTTPSVQGVVTPTGTGGHIELDDIRIVSGKTVTITVFTLTGGNADG